MYYIGVDLGSTNLKATLYDEAFHVVGRASERVLYARGSGIVEFEAEQYFDSFASMIRTLIAETGIDTYKIRSIGFTGQAETLVILGKGNKPLMNAISWMDERSKEECRMLEELFTPEEIRRTTGQMAALPTWPATKILWLRRNRPDLFEKAEKYVLLKDYMIYRMTGKLLADMSIATFSFYFDIYRKCYWQKMMQTIGIREEQLPPLVEPLTVAGCVTDEAAAMTCLLPTTEVSIGTLDHFAGMIGTGNINPGGVSLSTGTVMALAVMAKEPCDPDCGIAMHYGFLPDTHVMLPVVESGGVSLEWFKNACLPNTDYDTLNEALTARDLEKAPIFLPYIVGTNPPEFDPDATGVFWGLRQYHDAIDMAGAVMEGVSCILRKNTDMIKATGTKIERIIATGGGAKSAIWCKLQADYTGLPVVIPADTEAACLGAAIGAAVGAGDYPDLAAACETAVSFTDSYEPEGTNGQEERYQKFLALFEATRRI